MMNVTCASCRFWRPPSEGVHRLEEYMGKAPDLEVVGECRRNAPTLSQLIAVWPATRKSSWCGEYAEGAHPWDGKKAAI